MSVPSSDWRFWLALKAVRGVGNVVGVSLVRAFGSPRAVFAAARRALEQAGARPAVAAAVKNFDGWAEIDAQLARLRAAGGRLVTWNDAQYPHRLRQIHDPPPFLFVKGEITAGDGVAVAVVGSRSASAYGRQMARRIATGLARCGVTVISGLARGIDAEAHRAALRANGRTIAVLGCGIDVVYPSEHKRLQADIARNGVVFSEFMMGVGPEAEHFPVRNRVISGLTLATVVVEATRKSGSLITARCALEQGREVFAVPGPVGDRSRGTHWLLREGAALAECAGDIVAEIAPQVRPVRQTPPAPPLGEDESRVLACLDRSRIHVDEIVLKAGIPAAKVLEALLSLELSGIVRQEPGKFFRRGDEPAGGAAVAE